MRYYKHRVTCALISTIFILAAVFSSAAAEYRIFPRAYRACGPKEKGAFHTTMLWDSKEQEDFKWCCYHAGYNVRQVHWVIMDLGRAYPITRIEVVHDGNETDAQHLITEDYNLFGGVASMNGPWTPLEKVVDNTRKRNVFTYKSRPFRYIGVEVRDTQMGHGLNSRQDDWAVRINELYVYSSEKQDPIAPEITPSPAGNSPFITSGRANRSAGAPSEAGGGPPAPGANSGALRHLYVFCDDNAPEAALRRLLNRPAPAPALSDYQISFVRLDSGSPLVHKYQARSAPTLVITDAAGGVLKKKTFIAGENDLAAFLK